MSRLSNYRDCIQHVQPQNLILDLGGNPLSSMEGKSQAKLLSLLGYELPKREERLLFGKVRRINERILTFLDIDTRSVGEILKPKNSPFAFLSKDMYIDEWGIKRRYTGMYWDIVENPLKEADIEELDRYPWPDGSSIDIAAVEEYAGQAKKLFEAGEYVICAEHPVYGVFELGCWLCGFEDFLVKLYTDADFVRKLFDIILSYQKKVIDIYYGILGPYIHYTSSGDDFATQQNLFMSPQLFVELIKPYLAERIAYTKKYTKAQFLHHSCGSVYKLIGELVDAGVDILNPVQPVSEEMSPASLKTTYGKSVVFHGGIDTQAILPFGDKESIEEYVKNTIRILNDSGGYIFAAAHNIQDDVPSENIVYMFEAARKYGGRK